MKGKPTSTHRFGTVQLHRSKQEKSAKASEIFYSPVAKTQDFLIITEYHPQGLQDY
jgi:hypothetical protein